MTKHVVGTMADLPEDGPLIVEIENRSIGVFNVDGRLYAVRNRCPHAGGPLCLGEVVGLIESSRPGDYRYDGDRAFLLCPWHGWEFDMETGGSYFDPARMRVRTYDVTVAPARRPGPYTAETYDVSIEDDLVVIDIPQ